MPPLFRLAALAALLLCPAGLFGQDLYTLPLPNDGAVVIQTRGGEIISLRPTKLWTGLAPIPSPPTDPTDPPPTLTPFAQEVSKQTATVLSNGGSKTTGAALSEVYYAVSSAIADGSLPHTSALAAIKATTDMVMLQQPDAAFWAAWRTNVGNALNTLQQQGAFDTKEQIAAALNDVSKGLAHAAGYTVAVNQLVAEGNVSQPFIGGIDIARLIELIKLVMSLLELFKTFRP